MLRSCSQMDWHLTAAVTASVCFKRPTEWLVRTGHYVHNKRDRGFDSHFSEQLTPLTVIVTLTLPYSCLIEPQYNNRCLQTKKNEFVSFSLVCLHAFRAWLESCCISRRHSPPFPLLSPALILSLSLLQLLRAFVKHQKSRCFSPKLSVRRA